MKSFVCVLLLAAVAVAEPPLFRQRYNERIQRQDFETGLENEEAPYAPAGFRPTKEFNLPSRQEAAPPSTSYGIPDDSYGAPLITYTIPQTAYGVPEKSPETAYGVPENNEGEIEENESESEDQAEERVGKSIGEEKVENDKGKLQEEPNNKDAEVVSAQGVYYVLLPGSQLQRVQFSTENDVRNMAYTARLQYRNEDRAPVYVYSAVPQYQTAAYVQLF